MSEPQSDALPQEPHPSRTRTEPHVFDSEAAAAEWLAWHRANAAPPVDELEARRSADLHKAMALISLPTLP